MKRILAIIMALAVVAVLFSGCKKNTDRLNYQYDMSKYVKLDSFEVEVDTGGEKYKQYYSDRISELLEAKLTKGTVQKGDIANIDYVGKKDGVAFEGGTASGYDLEIGSNSFIPGFEDGLIGKEIGSTVDLNLTFPESYQSAELAGKAVVFTVKINSVMHTFDELNEENAKASGFASAEEVQADAEKYAKEGAAWDAVYEKAEIEYPEKETEVFFDFLMYNMEMQLKSSYGITLEQYVQYASTTLDEFKKTVRESSDLESLSHNYALSYYILDKNDVKIDKELFNERLELYGEEAVLAIGKEYFEASVAFEQAMEIIGQKATVK